MNELLDKAKSGDIEAFSELIKLIEKDLEKLAASKLVDKSYISDVLQNVYYKAYMKINTLEDNEKFKSWIFTILKNECINLNKFLARHKEINLENINNIEDTLNCNSESDINFEQMIKDLSEDEKKLLRMKFKENFSNLEISEELGIPYNTVKSKINRAIKKITLVILLLLVFSGFTVLATYIINQIRAHFTTSTNAINTAVENNYVQEIDSDFVYDNGIGIKVDAIVLDDKNLDISFVYDIQDKEKYGEITGITIKDYVIRTNQSILFDVNKANLNLIKLVREKPQKIEYVDNKLKKSILFSTTDQFPKFKNIIIQVNSIELRLNNKNYYRIEGVWNLEHEVIEKLNSRFTIKYYMENNTYAKEAKVMLLDTNINLEIEFNNIELTNKDIKKVYLYNDNNEFYWTESNFDSENNKLKITFDLSRYEDNIDELILKIPRKDEKDIIIKFRRDQ